MSKKKPSLTLAKIIEEEVDKLSVIEIPGGGVRTFDGTVQSSVEDIREVAKASQAVEKDLLSLSPDLKDVPPSVSNLLRITANLRAKLRAFEELAEKNRKEED